MRTDRMIAIQVPEIFIREAQEKQPIPCFLSFGTEAEHFPFAPL